MARSDAVLKELKKRLKQKEVDSAKPQLDFKAFCFDSQWAFLRGEGKRFRTAVCSRRAGKTVGIAADIISTCLETPNSVALYLTLTKDNCRNIIWPDILKILEDYEIEAKINEVRLTVKFNNGSRFVCSGVKDNNEVEKYRGWKLSKCYIDECQSFRPSILEPLIADVITPALRDLKGSLYLTGTPGPVKAGPFYKYSQSKMWNNHHWTAFDNPHMHSPPAKDLEETLEEEREMKGIDVNDPGYIRETYGKWVEDVDSLVFKFNPAVNLGTPQGGTWNYIFGIDIGFNDSDAIAVLAYSDKSPDVFLVDEFVKPKQNISQLVKAIEDLRDIYKPIKMVMDAGALGKKIQEELLTRFSLPIEAAEKTRKVEFIELLNDSLRTGNFKCIENSAFQEDCMLVQWDKESKIKNPERPKVSTTYHSDICDAVLYAWRASKHYHYVAPQKVLDPNTDEYMDALEERMAEELEERLRGDDWGIEQDEMDSIWDED